MFSLPPFQQLQPKVTHLTHFGIIPCKHTEICLIIACKTHILGYNLTPRTQEAMACGVSAHGIRCFGAWHTMIRAVAYGAKPDSTVCHGSLPLIMCPPFAIFASRI